MSAKYVSYLPKPCGTGVTPLANKFLEQASSCAPDVPGLPDRSRITANSNVVAVCFFNILAETPPMEERRIVPRKRVFKAGSIEFDGVTIDCIIRNVSSHGATLDVASPLSIPHAVTLNIITRQERQHCRIVWRGENRVGVAFTFGAADLSKQGSIPEAEGAL